MKLLQSLGIIILASTCTTTTEDQFTINPYQNQLVLDVSINSPVEISKNSTAKRLEIPSTTLLTNQADELNVPTGLFGLPFAPVGLTGCDEMRFYREQFGLPEIFDRIGYRESRCTNREDVRTYCCHGYWQLYFSLHVRDHRLAPEYQACYVTEISDYNGDEPLDKQKQACVAKALYDLMGTDPWSATR